MVYFKPLHLRKFFFRSVLINMNEHTGAVTLYYISVTTENSKLEHVRSVHHKRASEVFLVEGRGLKLFKKGIKFHINTGTGLVVQSILSSIHFCSRDTVQCKFQN